MVKESDSSRFENIVNQLIERGDISNKAGLARMLGVHPQIIYDTISGRLNVSGKMLLRMEQNFGVNKQYILSGQEPMFLLEFGDKQSNWHGVTLPIEYVKLLNEQMGILKSQQETIAKQVVIIEILTAKMN